jgi:hypothetical protein
MSPLYRSFPVTRKVLFGLTAGLLLASCDRDKGSVTPSYPVPTTYEFENVSYAGQTARLQMLGEMIKYIETAHTPGVVLDAQKLKDMYANANNPFTGAGLNASGKQLKDKTILSEQGNIEKLLEEVAAASRSTSPGSNGVAGVVTTKDGTKSYLLSPQGFDYAEQVEKYILGATFYFQATGVYLSEEKTGDAIDNVTVKPGEGTTMEHHWDEAFGYLGVPRDFLTNTTGLAFWGDYVNRRDAQLGSNAKLMNAFLKGRAAISNKDMKGKNEAIPVIREEWEKVSAATAISYLNRAKTNITDDAVRNHVLTEAIGFINALRFSPAKKISNPQVDQVLGFIGTNLYEVKAADLDKARDLLATVYGFADRKDAF